MGIFPWKKCSSNIDTKGEFFHQHQLTSNFSQLFPLSVDKYSLAITRQDTRASPGTITQCLNTHISLHLHLFGQRENQLNHFEYFRQPLLKRRPKADVFRTPGLSISEGFNLPQNLENFPRKCSQIPRKQINFLDNLFTRRIPSFYTGFLQLIFFSLPRDKISRRIPNPASSESSSDAPGVFSRAHIPSFSKHSCKNQSKLEYFQCKHPKILTLRIRRLDTHASHDGICKPMAIPPGDMLGSSTSDEHSNLAPQHSIWRIPSQPLWPPSLKSTNKPLCQLHNPQTSLPRTFPAPPSPSLCPNIPPKESPHLFPCVRKGILDLDQNSDPCWDSEWYPVLCNTVQQHSPSQQSSQLIPQAQKLSLNSRKSWIFSQNKKLLQNTKRQ